MSTKLAADVKPYLNLQERKKQESNEVSRERRRRKREGV
jgi:hypothetical protein